MSIAVSVYKNSQIHLFPCLGLQYHFIIISKRTADRAQGNEVSDNIQDFTQESVTLISETEGFPPLIILTPPSEPLLYLQGP